MVVEQTVAFVVAEQTVVGVVEQMIAAFLVAQQTVVELWGQN